MEAQSLRFRQNSSLVEERNDNDWFVTRHRLDLSLDPNFLHLPTGNTIQRGSTTNGRIRFNTDLQCFEATKQSQWNEIMIAGVTTSSTSSFLHLPSGNSTSNPNAPAGSLRFNITNSVIEATNGSGWSQVTRQYEQTFSYGNLSNGTIILNHNLNNRTLTSAIYDELNNQIIPDNLHIIDANTALLSVISFGTLVNNWSIILAG